MNFDDIKARASLPTRTVSLCLAGQLVDEIAKLELDWANAAPPTNIGEASPKRLIAEQIKAKQEEMRSATVEFHLRALGARAWTTFWATMPERVEGQSDEGRADAVFPFYADMVSRVCSEPAMTVAQVEELSELLHQRSWNVLVGACMAINTGDIDIPNSDAASELSLDSEPT